MNRLAELISRAGAQFGERVAVVGQDRAMTFAEVETESNCLASALAGALGVRQGERVAILLPNCPQFVVADFALIKAGLIRVPINPRYAPPEIEFILQHSGATALVTCAAYENVVSDVRRNVPSLRHVITIDAITACDVTAWDDVLQSGTSEPFAVDTSDGDGYMLAYTSGTTGRPKGALTTVKARWANVLSVYANETFVGPSDAMLHVASLAHGSGTKVFPLFAKGARNVLLAKFSPAAFFGAIEAHRITISWMVPTIVAMLADAPERGRFDCSSLRTVIYGGARMPEPTLRRAIDAFGPIFVQIYGLTEAPHPDLVLGKEEHRFASGALRTDVTGRAAVGARIRLVDDTGRDVPAGSVGEILVAGDHVMSGYWNDPIATAATLEDGWCHTGDLARVDAEGFYSIVDRKKEMIISGGYNVYPREVEDVLYRHPGVAECAVIGAPDDLWGEAVHALVVAKPGAALTADAIAAHCAGALAGYKKPRKVTFLAELPRTANGKVDKKALRARFSRAASQAKQMAS